MKIRYLATALATLTVWSASATADIPSGLMELSTTLDRELCRDGVDYYGFCEMTFYGAFGDSGDTYRDTKRDRERVNRKHDLGCPSELPPHPIEDAHCNETNSKAEWRHDSLKLKLESAIVEYAKDRYASGDSYVCSLVGDAENMYAGSQLDEDGYEAIVVNGVNPIIDAEGIICEVE